MRNYEEPHLELLSFTSINRGSTHILYIIFHCNQISASRSWRGSTDLKLDSLPNKIGTIITWIVFNI